MAIAHRRVSIANPARRRKMSAKQIRFFGTKRQKAGLRAKRSAPAHRARTKRRNTTPRRRNSPRAVRRNLGEQVLLTLGNPKRPGRKRNPGGAKNRLVIVNPGERMAKGSGRVISGYGSTVMNGRRRKRSMAKRRKKQNPASVHHRRRPRHNRAVHHRRRRNSPMGGSWGAEITQALYIIAGAVGSKMGAQMVLGTSNTGFLGYGANLAAGGILAWLAKSFMKNDQAAKGVFAGAVVQVVLRLITDYTPFGQYASLSGVGDYMASNFVTPQRYVDGLRSAQIEMPDGWGPAPSVMASSGVNANAVAAGSDGMGGW